MSDELNEVLIKHTTDNHRNRPPAGYMALMAGPSGRLTRILDTGAQIPVDPDIQFTYTDNQDGTATLTCQVLKASGQPASGVYKLQAHFAATENAAPADLGDLAVTTGTQLIEHTTDAMGEYLTNTSGKLVMTLTRTATGAVVGHFSASRLQTVTGTTNISSSSSSS